MVGSRVWDEIVEKTPIELKSLRYNPTIEFNRPGVYNILGIKDSGKSMLNEALALRHHKIIDFYASRDNESLAWCRDSSPIDDILLIVGDNVDLHCSWPTKKISDLTLKDIMSYEGIVTCDSFFSSQDSKHFSLARIPDILYQRLGWTPGKIIFIIVRESNSFLYSRQKLGDRMKDAKQAFIFFTREIRHFGCSTGIDLLRWTGTDKDLRDNADYTFLKQVGSKRLPDDLKFTYAWLHPASFAQMKPNRFFMIKKDGALAIGKFPKLAFHKEEGVNLLKELGIEVEYGEDIDEGKLNALGDREHEEIIRGYVDVECSSMRVVSRKLHKSTATISSHITFHNKAVEESGKCPRCNRLGSDLADVRAANPKYL